MNWFWLPTLLLGFAAYELAKRWARMVSSRGGIILSCIVVLVLALPGLAYALYYSKALGEPIWFYKLRTITGSELLASLMGFAAGWMQCRIVPKLKLSKFGTRTLVPAALAFVLALPYLKPVFRPLRISSLQENWQDGVCLQSSASTCGPAAAASVVRLFGGNVSEQELARQSFTCATGTENWYLARSLRKLGFATTFVSDSNYSALPAIAGVLLKEADNSGHFIALLQRQGDRLVIGDPMAGRSTNSLAELREKYDFTGFSLVIRPKESSTQ